VGCVRAPFGADSAGAQDELELSELPELLLDVDSLLVLDDEDPESPEDDEPESDFDDERAPDFDDERLSVL